MKWRTLATVLFAAVGVYAIVEAVILLQPLTMILAMSGVFEGDGGVRAAQIALAGGVGLICPTVLLVIGLWLLLRPPLRGLAERIPGGEATTGSPSCRMLLRASVMVIGIWVLCRAAPKLINFVYVLMMEDFPEGYDRWRTLWPTAAQVVVSVAMGVYLLWGAPHLVRWMVGRLEESAEADDDDDDAPQSRPRITT